MKKLYDYEYFIRKILGIIEYKKSEEKTLLEVLNIKKENEYSDIEISKVPKSDDTRTISVLNKNSKLRLLQKNLYQNFLIEIPLVPACKGFTPKSSYLDYLKPHIGKRYFLRIDIKDFFGSISSGLIIQELKEYVSVDKIIDDIIEICTLKEVLPQGAITSPVLSNIIFRKIDYRITKYCQAVTYGIREEAFGKIEDIMYTRYADDLLFSSNWLDFNKYKYFRSMIANILYSFKFKVNRKKIHIQEGLLSLSGFVINQDVHLSRKKMKNINNLIYYFDYRKEYNDRKYKVNSSKIKDEKLIENINKLSLKASDEKTAKFNDIKQLINYLCGYRAFIIGLLKGQDGSESLKILSKKIVKIEEIIDALTAEEERRRIQRDGW